jgi:hypothetical protein
MKPFGQYVYERMLVSYLDFLGFKKMVARSVGHLGDVEKLARLIESMRLTSVGSVDLHRPPAAAFTPEDFHSISFSDLTVRATAVSTNEILADALHWELHFLAHVQLNLALAGYLVRGAICLGNLFIDSTDAFGPALIRAYELERDHATHPRIIIDDELLSFAESEGIAPLWDDCVGVDSDGGYFLDYLFGLMLPLIQESPNHVDLQKIRSHAELIETLLKSEESAKDAQIRKKHIWLRDYHNRTISKLRGRVQNSKLLEEYLISTKDNPS